jgi:DegV family protein with EDD domain
MGRIAFVTDSTAGIPTDMVEQFKVTVVPLQVVFGTETFRDGIDLTEEQFFERLKSANPLPTTSQPTVGDFEETYRKLLADPDVESIISVHLSTKLSGTVSAATTAAERIQQESGSAKKIAVIDSLEAYMGEGLLVINGARAAEKGKGHDEIVSMLEEMKHKIHLYLLVDTLEFLKRGGRIGGAQALLGTMLNIKPILQLKEGRIEPYERVRTRRKAMERITEIGAEAMQGRPVQMAIGHAQAAEDAQALTAMAKQKMNVVEEFHTPLGPVISTHTGPGVLGFVLLPVEG